MKAHPPRIRLFAGPNGSGKSTVKDRIERTFLAKFPGRDFLGVHLNPDDIERSWRERGFFDFRSCGLDPDEGSLRTHLQAHPLVARRGDRALAERLRFDGPLLRCEVSLVDSYLASILVDHLRHRLLGSGRDFSFESVMSSPDKVDFLEKARSAGYRTYLYYVTTEDPEINIRRVEARRLKGGHGVPRDKIVSRYGKSLDLLLPAIRASNRAFLFDNSERAEFVAEYDGEFLMLREDYLRRKGRPPAWYMKYAWRRRPIQ